MAPASSSPSSRPRPPRRRARQVLHMPPLQENGRSMPGADRRIQHRLAVRDRHLEDALPSTVSAATCDMGGRLALGQATRRTRAGHAASGRGEALDMHALRLGTPRSASAASTRVDHAERATQDIRSVDPRCRPGCAAAEAPASPGRHRFGRCSTSTSCCSCAQHVKHGDSRPRKRSFRSSNALAEQDLAARRGCRRTGRSGYPVRATACRAS